MGLEPPPVILVPGTYGFSGGAGDLGEWWYPGVPAAVRQTWWYPGDPQGPPSPFVQAARTQGLTVLGAGDPFIWSTDVGGIGWRRHTDWQAAADALRWYAQAKTRGAPVSLIAHSHGGAACVASLARGLPDYTVDVLVTLGMPVRSDWTGLYVLAASRVRRWVVVESRQDWWQRFLGMFGADAGQLPTSVVRVAADDLGHTDLHDPAEWTARGWWAWLR